MSSLFQKEENMNWITRALVALVEAVVVDSEPEPKDFLSLVDRSRYLYGGRG